MNSINTGYPQLNAQATPPINTAAIEEPRATSKPLIRNKRGIGATHRRWPQHSTVTIAFKGTTKEQEELVKKGFSKFTPHINLTFKYVPGPDADIRIGPTENKGENGSSYIGINAKKAAADKLTFFMDFDREPENVIATAVHEGLHAIGVLHEHQHPDRSITFNKEKVLERFKEADDPQKTMQSAVLDTVKRQKNGPMFTPYDPLSIMHYEFESEDLNGAPAIPKNNELSAGDIALLRLMYPPRPLPSLENSIAQLHATAATAKLWPDLSTVTVSLLGMGDEQKKFVKHNIEKLQPYINTHIKFTDKANSNIRITLTDNGKSWSETGTDANSAAPSAPTMGIHWDSNKKKTTRDVKHMFAKALGFTSITLPKNTA